MIDSCIKCGKPYIIKPIIRYDIIPYYGSKSIDDFGNKIKK